ncbi:MAG TPA: hypothetical protein VG122_03730 [Gemmata sp.]|nr:hypothetical protein [Gemmata sp.]
MVTATGNVDMTALALGINAQTARTYYLAAKQAFNTEDAFKMAAEKLNPKLD